MAWFDGSYKDVSLGPGQVRMCGSFLCNGSSAVSEVKGRGFTVARSATGDYEVTLGPSTTRLTPFKALISWKFGYMAADATAADLKVNSSGTDVTSATAPKVVITNAPSGTPTDLTSVRVSFEFILATEELND